MSVVIVEYDPNWPIKFEFEKAKLLSCISEYICGTIEHVGSTAVYGMHAKPTIDIMVGVESLEKSRSAIPLLENIGYCYYPYKPEKMHWFCKPSPEIRTHHLHLVPYGDSLWNERLAFKRALQENQKVFNDYLALKLRLSEEVGYDRELYTQQKTPFIKKVLDELED